MPVRALRSHTNPPSCHCHETLCRPGTCPRRCRNHQVRTYLFMPTVCRFAVLGDMSPPYRGCFVYRGAFFACGLRGAQRRGNLMQERPTAYKPVRRLAKKRRLCIAGKRLPDDTCEWRISNTGDGSMCYPITLTLILPHGLALCMAMI